MPQAVEQNRTQAQLDELSKALSSGTFVNVRHMLNALPAPEIAMLLEEKTAIPAVKAQLGYLAALQDSGFWEGISLAALEDLLGFPAETGETGSEDPGVGDETPSESGSE